MTACESNIQELPLYINPLTDYGFKKVFGDEEIMREFLNDLLKLPSPIKHVNFLNKDMLPENDELKAIVYDMRCETEAGGEVIVECRTVVRLSSETAYSTIWPNPLPHRDGKARNPMK